MCLFKVNNQIQFKMNKCIEMSTGTIGAAIFTVMNVVCSGAGSYLSMVAVMYLSVKTKGFWLPGMFKSSTSTSSNVNASAAEDALFGIPIVLFLLWLSFTIVLIVGICKRNATLVMCFFVYGVMILVVGVVLPIYSLIDANQLRLILLPLLFLLFDGPALFMILMIYKTFRNEVQFQSLMNLMTPLDNF